MIKEFIPYEQALELKELGFDEPCFGNWQDMKEETPWFSKSYADNQNQYYGQLCSAPTFSQAFRFFREKYEVFGIVNFGTNDFTFNIYNSDGLGLLTKESLAFNGTYQEAELACLRKLIEIVKND